jgi:hypothetical protein
MLDLHIGFSTVGGFDDRRQGIAGLGQPPQPAWSAPPPSAVSGLQRFESSRIDQARVRLCIA